MVQGSGSQILIFGFRVWGSNLLWLRMMQDSTINGDSSSHGKHHGTCDGSGGFSVSFGLTVSHRIRIFSSVVPAG